MTVFLEIAKCVPDFSPDTCFQVPPFHFELRGIVAVISLLNVERTSANDDLHAPML
jgi:hypothetical protein